MAKNYKPKVYLAGPMSNIPQFNIPNFLKGEKILKDSGYEVFNPGRHDLETYGDILLSCKSGTHEEIHGMMDNPPTYRECLRIDLNWILDNADTIAFLPGWEKSKGCQVEKALADCLQLDLIYLSDDTIKSVSNG
jgi:hypothetical protein